MNTIEIILATISAAMILEGIIIVSFPKSVARNIKKIFKNKKQARSSENRFN